MEANNSEKRLSMHRRSDAELLEYLTTDDYANMHRELMCALSLHASVTNSPFTDAQRDRMMLRALCRAGAFLADSLAKVSTTSEGAVLAEGMRETMLAGYKACDYYFKSEGHEAQLEAMFGFAPTTATN